jgi:pimeloyl-ACP methyl ester carboxylesterase
MLDIMSPLFVTIEGRRIAYAEVCPSSPKGTILLLTGLHNQRISWDEQLALFGKEYRTIAIDYRDTGDSDPVNSPYYVADLAEDAAAVLRALRIVKSHIVGISMGGMVALELVLRHAEMVDRLVLVSTTAKSLLRAMLSPRTLPRVLRVLFSNSTLEPGEQKRRAYSLLMAPGYAEHHPEEMERIAEIGRLERITEQAHNRQVRACMRHDVSKRLSQIKTPTLVIHGEEDPGIVVKNGIDLARRITDARLIVYPNTGHILPVEHREEFNRDVLEFLGEGTPD